MKRGIFLLLLFLFAISLWAQAENASSYVGMRLADLIERFGSPKTVYSARGNELWQDDVVFQYDQGDFFIYRDRVWQVRVPSANGIAVGEPKQAAFNALGNAEDRGDHIFMPLTGAAWPLMLRANVNSAGRIAAIYIFRTDS